MSAAVWLVIPILAYFIVPYVGYVVHLIREGKP